MQASSASEVLEQFLPTVENIPSEVRFLCSELLAMAPELQKLEQGMNQTDASLRKMIKAMPAGQIGDPDAPLAPAAADDKEDAEGGDEEKTNDSSNMDVDASIVQNENNTKQLENLTTTNVTADQDNAEKEATGTKAALLESTKEETMSMIKEDAEQIKLYEKIHDHQLFFIEMQDKRLSMIERAKESVDRHIKRLEFELEKLEDVEGVGAGQSMVSGSVSTQSIASYEAPKKTVVATSSIGGRGWETPIVAVTASTQKKALGSSQLKTVISIKKTQKRKIGEVGVDPDERAYCICQGVSYGEMVACDGKACPYEWFHYECVKLTEPPKGQWFCDFCKSKQPT